jgi:formaldehyde-activating enzyme involved in methanogenesis
VYISQFLSLNHYTSKLITINDFSQIRGLYGNEQQKVAAAVTKATEQNKINNEEVPEELEPSVSVDTTIEQKSSPCDAQEDPCHDVG